MYKKGIYKILANEPLTASVWRMVLEGDTEWIVRPGQFVNIALEAATCAVRFRCATAMHGPSRSSIRSWAEVRSR